MTPGERPRRIQRQRAKGWRMPEGAIYVGRPSRWGNPHQAVHVDCYLGGMCWAVARDGELVREHMDKLSAVCWAVDMFAANCQLSDVIDSLRGHDLACWCPLDQPCHADVLLKLANR